MSPSEKSRLCPMTSWNFGSLVTIVFSPLLLFILSVKNYSSESGYGKL